MNNIKITSPNHDNIKSHIKEKASDRFTKSYSVLELNLSHLKEVGAVSPGNMVHHRSEVSWPIQLHCPQTLVVRL